MIDNLVILTAVINVMNFVATMIVFNRLLRKPVARKLVIFIDGRKGNTMQILKADKQYKVEFKGEDRDGNPVALDPSITPVVSLSIPEAGEITANADGSFNLNPNKVGAVALQAQVGELVGTLECEIIAGDLFKVALAVSEVQEQAPEVTE